MSFSLLLPLDRLPGYCCGIRLSVLCVDMCAENGFTLSKEIVALPMWRLSAGCRIHLSFSYRGNVAERGGTGLVQGIKRWTGGGDQEKSQ